MSEYTVGTLLCWHVASMEARAAEHSTIKPGHLFIGLCAACQLSFEDIMTAVGEGASLDQVPAVQIQLEELRRIFRASALDLSACMTQLREVLGREGTTPRDGIMHRDVQTKVFFARAEAITADSEGKVLRPVHLLAALLEDDVLPWNAVLHDLGVDRAALLESARAAAHLATPADLPAEPHVLAPEREPAKAKDKSDSKTPLLDRYGRDITALARDGKLTPVIGRTEEMRRLGQVLLQRLLRNAVLVGDAGVGKTCLVEGLAQQLVRDDVPALLKGKRIIEISAASLVMGTKYRGEFEERLHGIIAEVTADPSIILFIDEFHTLMGAGATGDGNMDAADLLKPVLARGELQCIGATTTQEYRRYIEKDTAFESRFEIIWVNEPTRDETLNILRGWRATIEAHYNLTVTDDALAAAVDLSIRYLTEQRLPRKAMNLIDRACSRAILQSFSEPGTLTAVERLQVALVVASEARVPLEQLTEHEASRLLRMEEALQRRVKGQQDAISTVSRVVRKARAGLKGPKEPLGVFLFLGPTGTGKTELAKAAAEFLFGSEDRLITVNMAEYGERHTVSRLIGSPPGYVGYDEEGQLTGKIRTYPYSVVLLDEFEKASPDVHQLFLQVFDEGRITDAKGRLVSFREAIIILTSNLGVEIPRGIGFHAGDTTADIAALRARTLEEMRRQLRPELLNRISNVIVFDPLTKSVIREIIDKIVGDVAARVADRHISLTLEESAYELLMTQGFDERFGARAMERTIDRLLTDVFGEQLIARAITDGDTVTVVADGAALRLAVKEPAAPPV